MRRVMFALLLLFLTVGGATPASAGNKVLQKVWVGNARPDPAKVHRGVSWDPLFNAIVFVNAGKAKKEGLEAMKRDFPPSSGRVPPKYKVPVGTRVKNLYVQYTGGSYAQLCLHYNQPDGSYVIPPGEERYLSDYGGGLILSIGTCANLIPWCPPVKVTPKPKPKPTPPPKVDVPIVKDTQFRDEKHNRLLAPGDFKYPEFHFVAEQEVSPDAWRQVAELKIRGPGTDVFRDLDARYRHRFRELNTPGWSVVAPDGGYYILDLAKEGARSLKFTNEFCIITPPPPAPEIPKVPILFAKEVRLVDEEGNELVSPPDFRYPTFRFLVEKEKVPGDWKVVQALEIDGPGKLKTHPLETGCRYRIRELPTANWVIKAPESGEFLVDLDDGFNQFLTFLNELCIRTPPPPPVFIPPPPPQRIVLPPLPYELGNGYIRQDKIVGPTVGGVFVPSTSGRVVRCNKCGKPNCPHKPRPPHKPPHKPPTVKYPPVQIPKGNKGPFQPPHPATGHQRP